MIQRGRHCSSGRRHCLTPSDTALTPLPFKTVKLLEFLQQARKILFLKSEPGIFVIPFDDF